MRAQRKVAWQVSVARWIPRPASHGGRARVVRAWVSSSVVDWGGVGSRVRRRGG